MTKLLMKIILLAFAILLVGETGAQSDFSSNVIGVGVVVSNVGQSVDFYVNGIGMVKTGGFSLNEDFAKRTGLSNGVPFSVTVLRLEDNPQATEWKLMSFGKKTAHPKQNFIQDDLGMQYITIKVKALKPIIERLKKKNIPFLGSTPTQMSTTSHFLLVQDPDGNFVELIGPLE